MVSFKLSVHALKPSMSGKASVRGVKIFVRLSPRSALQKFVWPYLIPYRNKLEYFGHFHSLSAWSNICGQGWDTTLRTLDLTNVFRLEWMWLTITNTPAYYATDIITSVKKFYSTSPWSRIHATLFTNGPNKLSLAILSSAV